MACYQVDFADGSRMLIDANTESEARQYATEQSTGETSIVSCTRVWIDTGGV